MTPITNEDKAVERVEICGVCGNDEDIYHKGVRQGAKDFAAKIQFKIKEGSTNADEIRNLFLPDFLRSDLARNPKNQNNSRTLLATHHTP